MSLSTQTLRRGRSGQGSWLVPAAGFIASAVCGLAAAGVGYRYDESVTVGAFVRDDALTPFTHQILHNNHPLFSLAEHLVWRTGADSELAFRLLPILFFALATALVGRWTCRRWGALAGTVAVLAMVTHPLSVILARQARGYSLLVLTATTATLLMLRLLHNPGARWSAAGYVAMIAIGLATHLYMAVVVLSHVGLVLARRDWSPRWLLRWAVGSAFGALAFVAIPPTRVRRRFQPSFPADSAREILGSTWPSVLVLGACSIAFAAAHRRDWLMVALPAAAVAGIWVVLQPRDIYPRFLVWIVPGVAVATAWAVDRARWIAVPALLAAAAMAVVAWPVDEPGIRDAASLVDAARERGYKVCTIGSQALLAYTEPGIEFTGNNQRCDVLVSIGSWRPKGYEQALANLPHHAEMGAVSVAASVDTSIWLIDEGT